MTNVASPNSNDRRQPTDDAAEDPGSLVSVVEERDHAPDECTIYPAGADDEDLVTEWITAKTGSYVDLERMR